MAYPSIEKCRNLVTTIDRYAQLKHEYGAKRIPALLRKTERALGKALDELKRLPIDRKLARREPNDLAGIRALRPRGPRRMCDGLPARYRTRLEGALLARFAGCTLGAVVEGWPVEAV